MRRQGLGASESADALKDGKIDAFFWSGGLPTRRRAGSGAHAGHHASALIPSGDSSPALQREYGALYFPLEVPRVRVSRRRTRPCRSSASPTCWSSTRRCPSARLRHHARCCSRSRPSSPRSTPKRGICRCETAVAARPPPFHPGAMRFYRRKACGSSSRLIAERAAHAQRRRVAAGRLRAALLCRGLSRLRALLGPLHRPAADLSRQLPADRAGPDVPALSAQARGDRRGVLAGRLGCSIAAAIVGARRGRSSTSTRSSTAPPTRRRSTSCSARSPSCSCWRPRAAPSGWILPVTAAAFLAYAWLGPLFDRIGLPLLAHRGYGAGAAGRHALHDARGHLRRAARRRRDLHRPVHDLRRGARALAAPGAFFIDWALAAMRPLALGARPGRTVTLAGFLLGTVSGSGVATTVMLGIGGLAAAAARRLQRRRRPARSCRPPASARCCRRRRSARRRS